MAVYLAERGGTKWRRPDSSFGIDTSKPISRGLVSFVDERTGFDWARTAMSTFTGTTRRGTSAPISGLTRGFGAALGAGTTDAIALGSQSWTTDWSLALWVWRNGAPNAAPRLVDQGSTGALWLWLTASAVWQISRFTSGTAGVWTFPASATGQWQLFTVTQIGTGAPVVYVNGAPVAVTETTPPTGTAMNVAAALFLGNRSGADRNFDGLLSSYARWDRALSPGEAWSLYDPQTRWDLYGQPSTRVFFNVGSGVAFQSAWARNANTVIQAGVIR